MCPRGEANCRARTAVRVIWRSSPASNRAPWVLRSRTQLTLTGWHKCYNSWCGCDQVGSIRWPCADGSQLTRRVANNWNELQKYPLRLLQIWPTG